MGEEGKLRRQEGHRESRGHRWWTRLARQPDARKDGSVPRRTRPAYHPHGSGAARHSAPVLLTSKLARRLGAGIRNLRVGPRRAHQRRARDDPRHRPQSQAHHRQDAGARSRHLVLRRQCPQPLRSRDRELRPLQRPARQRGRKSSHSNISGHHKDLRTNRRRIVRSKQPLRTFCQARKKSIAVTKTFVPACKPLDWTLSSFAAISTRDLRVRSFTHPDSKSFIVTFTSSSRSKTNRRSSFRAKLAGSVTRRSHG